MARSQTALRRSDIVNLGRKRREKHVIFGDEREI